MWALVVTPSSSLHNPLTPHTQAPTRQTCSSISTPPSMRTLPQLQIFRVILKITYLVTHKDIFRVTHKEISRATHKEISRVTHKEIFRVTQEPLCRATHQTLQIPTTVTKLIPRPTSILSPPMLAAPEWSMVSLASQLSPVFSMGSLGLVMDTPVTRTMDNILIIITSLSCRQEPPITSSFTRISSSRRS